MKTKTAAEKLKAIESIGTKVIVPHNVYYALGGKSIDIFGDQLSLWPDGDYVTLEHARAAIAWYVHQLGGTVSWDK